LTHTTECPFCQKLTRLDSTPDDDLVWRFPHSVAFLGSWQFYQGYCILVARQHATELNQQPVEVRQAYFEELCFLARAIEETFQPLKLNYELLGNQVPHLHWHVFPRYADDPQRLKPVWLALDLAETDEAEKRRLKNGRFDRPTIMKKLIDKLSNLSSSPS
jgi:diadenosine tetraphosphate (Ap4A) HIT family hydrolase